MSASQDRDGKASALKDVIAAKDFQIEALLAKMDEMKRSLDEVKLQHFDAKKVIDQMNSADFAKKNLILKR